MNFLSLGLELDSNKSMDKREKPLFLSGQAWLGQRLRLVAHDGNRGSPGALDRAEAATDDSAQRQ
jgi:hypothetical protein